MSLRIVFMGTPEFSVPSLVELVGHGHEIVAVYTQPPRPAGRRGLELKKSPVHERAEAFGIPVFTPASFKEEVVQTEFSKHNADVAIVIAYGLILPLAVLKAPKFGCYNGHASLLPRWRGAAPIQRAIMAGDMQTGVNIMRMDEGLDTGDVAFGEKIAIGADMTAGELHDALSALTAVLMIKTTSALEQNNINLTAQPEKGVCYAKKISKEETRIDWSLPAEQVHNQIRGLSPFPGSWCEMKINERTQRVKILKSSLAVGEGSPGSICMDGLTIACGSGAVSLERLQRAGKQAQSSDEFLHGNTIEAVF